MEERMFTLTPMNQDIELKAGQTYTGSITVVNPSDATEDFSYKVSVNPFSVIGSEYNVDLATEYNRSMMTKWITIAEPTGTLKPNESRQVEFTINVPEGAPAGGQYAALTVTADNSGEDGGGLSVQSVLEMASVIYAKVAGETIHQGKILQNNVPSFATTTPVILSAEIENTGNVHDYANYTITVTDVFTGQVILPTAENDGHYSEVIMPETTYHSEREVSNLPAIGVVKVSQTIRFNGEVSVQENNIVICPVWFMVLVLLTLAALITTIVLIIKKHRRHKKELSAI
ncbi:hypothetical protein IKE80_01895 [Candidatus Saccharibacteria bacterium]|nr:hypothetical protein [Candidatus Saccharibacteria bacterium]MCR5700371.1 DUF916 domain-containing protein [Candidatus Saccharibacteria bacterium]